MRASAGQVPRWFHNGFLIVTGAFLYLDLFILPATPIAGTDLDQSIYLHNATKMFDGQMIYRDFFQFTPPGTELVYLVLFKLFGIHAWIPNAALVVLGLSLTWLSIFISKQILSGQAAYLPAFLFLALAFHPAMDGSHHWFSMLAVTAAIALMIKDRNLARVAEAGVLCAVASFFTQPRGAGAVVGLAIFLWWEHRRKPEPDEPLWKSEAILAATFTVATAVLNIYFLWNAGLKRFLWCTVIFGIKYYPAESKLNSLQAYLAFPPMVAHLRHVPQPGWLLIHALLPLVYLLFFARCWRESKKSPDQPWDRLMLVSSVGFFLFLGVAPAPIFWRLFVVSLPGLIVLAWFLDSPGKLLVLARRVLWIGTAAAMVSIVWNHQTRWRAILETPTGRAAFFEPDEYQRYKWLASRTHPPELFFDCSGKSYFLLGLRSPAKVSFLSGTDYLRPEQVLDLTENLERHRVPVILWCSDLDAAIRPDDHLGPLRDYLRTHYHATGPPDNSLVFLERNAWSLMK